MDLQFLIKMARLSPWGGRNIRGNFETFVDDVKREYTPEQFVTELAEGKLKAKLKDMRGAEGPKDLDGTLTYTERGWVPETDTQLAWLLAYKLSMVSRNVGLPLPRVVVSSPGLDQYGRYLLLPHEWEALEAAVRDRTKELPVPEFMRTDPDFTAVLKAREDFDALPEGRPLRDVNSGVTNEKLDRILKGLAHLSVQVQIRRPRDE